MGGAFGVASFGAVLNNRLAVYLAGLVPAGRFETSALRSGPEAVRSLPENIRVPVVEAFARVLHVTFL
jgi:hypothetical protein